MATIKTFEITYLLGGKRKKAVRKGKYMVQVLGEFEGGLANDLFKACKEGKLDSKMYEILSIVKKGEA